MPDQQRSDPGELRSAAELLADNDQLRARISELERSCADGSERLFHATAQAVSEATGEEFFKRLVEHLARSLRCEFAEIGVFAPGNRNRIRSLAFFGGGKLLDNIEYDLDGTPCQGVVQPKFCIHPKGVQTLFPRDKFFEDVHAESYAGIPLFDAAGTVLGLICVIDVLPLEDGDNIRSTLQIFAARAAAEIERLQGLESLRTGREALADSERMFRQLAESIRDVFWMFDVPRDGLIYVSPAFEAIAQRPVSWIVADARRWMEIIHGDDRERIRGQVSAFRAGERFDQTYRIVRPDGSIRWIHDRRFTVSDGGFVGRIAGVAEDITERFEAEEKLQEQAAQLAHMARLSSMGELVASITHEVNQPLYVIGNFSGVISAALSSGDPLPADNLQKWTAEISKAVNRADAIIRRVRSYVSKGPLQRVELDLNAVAGESVDLVAFEARRHRAQVVLELAPVLPRLKADPVAIQQVLVNLLRNAFEALCDEPGTGREVRVSTQLADGGIEVAVLDAGRGIDPQDVGRLFTTFYTSKPDGMGMGLAISKTIVEAHRGRIWATANPHRGSTFHFFLPFGDGPRVGRLS